MQKIRSRALLYNHSTDEIEYSVNHFEYRLPISEMPPNCDIFMATIIAKEYNGITCLNVEKDENYYKSHEQRFIDKLRSHYPEISTTSATKVSNTFTDILLYANAAHRCPKCTTSGSTTIHRLVFEIWPRSGRYRDGEVIVFEESWDDEGVVRRSKSRPATRASVIELLKTEVGSSIEEGECGICMDNMEIKTSVRMPCSHSFHRVCLLQWLNNGHSCPICRYEMPPAHHL